MGTPRGESQSVKLSRIEERMDALKTSVEEKTDAIKSSVDGLRSHIDDNFVTQQEFKPIRLIVYGLVGAILLSVLAALVASVIVQTSAAQMIHQAQNRADATGR